MSAFWLWFIRPFAELLGVLGVLCLLAILFGAIFAIGWLHGKWIAWRAK